MVVVLPARATVNGVRDGVLMAAQALNGRPLLVPAGLRGAVPLRRAVSSGARGRLLRERLARRVDRARSGRWRGSQVGKIGAIARLEGLEHEARVRVAEGAPCPSPPTYGHKPVAGELRGCGRHWGPARTRKGVGPSVRRHGAK